jgi:hypothetical protein
MQVTSTVWSKCGLRTCVRTYTGQRYFGRELLINLVFLVITAGLYCYSTLAPSIKGKEPRMLTSQKTDHSHPSSDETKNAWSFTIIFYFCGLCKHSDKPFVSKRGVFLTWRFISCIRIDLLLGGRSPHLHAFMPKHGEMYRQQEENFVVTVRSNEWFINKEHVGLQSHLHIFFLVKLEVTLLLWLAFTSHAWEEIDWSIYEER